MDYKMIVLDLDGTLTNSKKEITAPTLKALLGVQQRGYKVVLASGRPVSGIVDLAERLKLSSYGGYILAFNGARIINCKTQEIVYDKKLPLDVLPTLYETAKKYDVGIISYTNDLIVSGNGGNKYIDLEAFINHVPVKEVEDFPNFIDFPINKCLLPGEPDRLVEAEKELKKKFKGYINIYRSEPFFLEVMAQNIDKAHSLLKLLGSLGLTTDQMICCGDGFNDITMIECAGLGVAMENAQEAVKEAADYVTASNDADGILQVIEKFMP